MFLRRQVSEIVFITLLFHCAAGLRTHYTDSLCTVGGLNRAQISLQSTTSGSSSSAILKTSSSYQPNLFCSITIKPPAFHGVVASVRKIDFRQGCVDNITFVSSGFYPSTDTRCGYINDYSESLSIYSPGEMTIVFKTGRNSVFGTLPISRDGFQVTLTAYKAASCVFSTSEYSCSNNRCISKSLTCDSHNHCGDRSDQAWSICKEGTGTPAGKIVGGVLGCIFLLIAVVAGMIYFRSKRRIITSTTVHQPPPQPYVQQPYPTQQQSYGQPTNPMYR